jgi:dCTP deaminase
VWPDRLIRYWGENGGVDPFDPDCVNPASYDLKLGNTYRVPAGPDEWSEELPFDELELIPLRPYLFASMETICIPPQVSISLQNKSTTGRKFIEHLHAGYLDPGFCGQITFEVVNFWPYARKVHAGERLFQVIFTSMAFIPEVSYMEKADSHYVNQCGPTPNWDCVGDMKIGAENDKN